MVDQFVIMHTSAEKVILESRQYVSILEILHISYVSDIHSTELSTFTCYQADKH